MNGPRHRAAQTGPSWPLKRNNSTPLSASHIRAVPSVDAVTILCSSTLNSAKITLPSWPRYTCNSEPFDAYRSEAMPNPSLIKLIVKALMLHEKLMSEDAVIDAERWPDGSQVSGQRTLPCLHRRPTSALSRRHRSRARAHKIARLIRIRCPASLPPAGERPWHRFAQGASEWGIRASEFDRSR